MPRYYVKKPNGRWNIFSSVVDDYVVEDATIEFLKAYKLGQSKEEIENDINSLLTNNPTVNVMDYKEAERQRKLNK